MALEAGLIDAGVNGLFVVGVIVFALAKAIKYWAIATLGSRWSFRVLVPPASSLIQRGPYRFMRHPNYLGVMGELAGMAIISQSIIAGSLSVLVFAVLIAKRIRVEERALDRADAS
jgi:methyltransferase